MVEVTETKIRVKEVVVQVVAASTLLILCHPQQRIIKFMLVKVDEEEKLLIMVMKVRDRIVDQAKIHMPLV